MIKKLPDELVAELVEAGWTGPQIVGYLEKTRGIKVTRQAITVWKKRNGYEIRPTLHGWQKWDVRPEHMNTEPYRILKLWERKRQGMPLSERDRDRLDSGLRFLAGYDGVFLYDPDREGGPWFVVPRRAGVDNGVIREPDHARV